MLNKKDYPKSLVIGDQVYKVKWVKDFKRGGNTLAECDPSDLTITIKTGQSREETMKCFIHELLHAVVEFEGDIDIPHSLIYKLEEPIFRFIKDNLL